MKINRVIFYLWLAMFLFAGCISTKFSKSCRERIQYHRVISDSHATVHIAEIDPNRVLLRIIRAADQNLAPVSKIAHENQALLAINGGFFTAEGNPVGACKIDGRWISFPSKPRGVFGWDQQGKFYFDRLSGENNLRSISSEIQEKPWWHDADNILGGAPLLIYDGKAIPVEPEKTLTSFLDEKYARTALCVDSQNKLNFFVVDGGDRHSKQLGLRGGMSISELTRFLLQRGCTYALNLDGGYSSAFIWKNHKKNSFAITALPERPVATALAIYEK